MTPLLETQYPQPWFLVRRDGARSDVLMEFDTRAEAEDALCTASVELLIEPDATDGEVPIAIYTADQMYEDRSLRDALATWQAQVVELELDIVRMMDEQFLGETPPILRPGRGSVT